MVKFCGESPFYDLGFVQTDENLWVKYNEFSIPHFVVSTTINPVSQTFVVKDLINNQMMSANKFESIRDFVLSNEREDKLKKILD